MLAFASFLSCSQYADLISQPLAGCPHLCSVQRQTLERFLELLYCRLWYLQLCIVSEDKAWLRVSLLLHSEASIEYLKR
jgi:hypothetical protein